jgi:hypothetical protein
VIDTRWSFVHQSGDGLREVHRPGVGKRFRPLRAQRAALSRGSDDLSGSCRARAVQPGGADDAVLRECILHPPSPSSLERP